MWREAVAAQVAPPPLRSVDRRPSAQQHLDSFAVPLFGNMTVNTDEILMNTVNTDEYTDEILMKYILTIGATAARRSLCDAE